MVVAETSHQTKGWDAAFAFTLLDQTQGRPTGDLLSLSHIKRN